MAFLRFMRAQGKMQYPFSPASHEIYRSPLAHLKTLWETRRIVARERRNELKAKMTALRAVASLTEDDLPLVFVSHNEIALLPLFLKHYRMLGVTRFICADDASTDGSREYLLDQSDVDVWTSTQRFAEARRGRLWREFLFNRYGLNRWYINVDADEFLIYDQYATKPLKVLIKILDGSNILRLPAPMLDMYSAQIGGQSSDSDMPWTIADHFDPDGYVAATVPRGISVTGGPRARLFQEQNELMKYPLIYWDDDCYFGSSIHRPTPYERNFATTWGVLLHFKFFTNYRDKILEAAANRQHYGDSKHYIAMAKELETFGGIDFYTNSSLHFSDSRQMAELGYISRIDFGPEEE